MMLEKLMLLEVAKDAKKYTWGDHVTLFSKIFTLVDLVSLEMLKGLHINVGAVFHTDFYGDGLKKRGYRAIARDVKEDVYGIGYGPTKERAIEAMTFRMIMDNDRSWFRTHYTVLRAMLLTNADKVSVLQRKKITEAEFITLGKLYVSKTTVEDVEDVDDDKHNAVVEIADKDELFRISFYPGPISIVDKMHRGCATFTGLSSLDLFIQDQLKNFSDGVYESSSAVDAAFEFSGRVHKFYHGKLSVAINLGVIPAAVPVLDDVDDDDDAMVDFSERTVLRVKKDPDYSIGSSLTTGLLNFWGGSFPDVKGELKTISDFSKSGYKEVGIRMIRPKLFDKFFVSKLDLNDFYLFHSFVVMHVRWIGSEDNPDFASFDNECLYMTDKFISDDVGWLCKVVKQDVDVPLIDVKKKIVYDIGHDLALFKNLVDSSVDLFSDEVDYGDGVNV